MTYEDWHHTEETLLRHLWNVEGKTAEQCAEFLPGRSRAAITGKARRMGLVERDSPIVRNTPERDRLAIIAPDDVLEEHDDSDTTDISNIITTTAAAVMQDIGGSWKHCQFMFGESSDRDFCGKPVEREHKTAYCPEHHAVCHKRKGEELG